MKTSYLVMLIPIGLLVGGCLPNNDEERCNGDYVWNPDTLACKLKKENPDEKPDDAGAADSGEEGFGDSPTGLGEPCSSQDDCARYQASLCTATDIRPDEGYCTVLGCSSSPDNCPSEFHCCVFNNAEVIAVTLKVPPDVELSSVCFNQEQYKSLLDFEMCAQ